MNELKNNKLFFLYVLRCSGGSLYVGSAQNVEKRLKEHNDGKAAVYTRVRRPVKLEYVEKFESRRSAMQREKQIKRWTRIKKEALIKGDLKILKEA